MKRIKYSQLLFEMLVKKKILYITMIVNIIIILLLYLFSVLSQNNLFKIHEFSESASLIKSGLISNPINLIVAFVSSIPFSIIITWTIFKEGEENGSELIIMSKRISRGSIFLQKYFVILTTIFAFSFSLYLTLIIVSIFDNVMTIKDRMLWAISMFFGFLIVSISISSFFILLLTLFETLPAILTTIVLFSSFPIVTAILIDKDPELGFDEIHEREQMQKVMANPDAWNVGYKQNFDSIDYEYNGEASNVYLGRKEALKKTPYLKYSNYDLWQGVVPMFNIFSNNDNSSMLRGSWTNRTKLNEMITLNENNSVEINGIKYARMYSNDEGRIIRGKNGELWLKEIIEKYNHESHEHQNSVSKEVIKGSSKSAKQIRGIVLDTIDYLKTNDEAAQKYKQLSFLGQTVFFYELLNFYNDGALDVAQTFKTIMEGSVTNHGILDHKDEIIKKAKEAYRKKRYLINKFQGTENFTSSRWASPDGFIEAKTMIDLDKSRFSPNEMYPRELSWEKEIANGNEWIKHGNFLGFYSSDGYWNIPHYNEIYKSSTLVKSIWIIFSILIIPTSIGLYIRKDFK